MKQYITIMIALTLIGCGKKEVVAEKAADNYIKPQTNRTPIPQIVRDNLGITFKKAEYRIVTKTVTMPGYFEPLPSAQQHYPLPLAGRVKIHTKPLDVVKKGQLLLEIDAPEWRDLQTKLIEARSEKVSASSELATAEATKKAAGEITEGLNMDVYTARIESKKAYLQATIDNMKQLISHAATLTSLSEEELLFEIKNVPLWQSLSNVPIKAVDDGVVRAIDAASGTWVVSDTEVIHIVCPKKMRFKAKALQADLIDYLRDGQVAKVVPPKGRGRSNVKSLSGITQIGVTGDFETRTVDVFINIKDKKIPNWARPQVAAMAEVAVAGDSDMEELSIPVEAVIQDGLEKVFFRRDPKNKDAVIRTVADLGPSDGRWITIFSGLAEGDEVVIDGVYQLKLATSSKQVKSGHFHSDGMFHDGEH